MRVLSSLPRLAAPGMRASIPEPSHPRRLTGLDGMQLALLALIVTCDIVAVRLFHGWQSALISDLICLGWIGVMLARPTWRAVILPLTGMGLVAGIFELFTDFSGHQVAHSLQYPVGEPMVWASPAYMPLSWMIVITQLGYLGWRLRGLLPLRAATLLAALAGAINVPFYEEMAYHAGWWRYTPAMLSLGHTPIYVAVFEGLIAASLPLLTAGLMCWGWRTTICRGGLLGVWMPFAAILAWLPLGTW